MQHTDCEISAPLQVVLPSLRMALGLSETPRVAFTGSGGKTTALFHLAREYPAPVIVTTTSHLETFQIKQADYHFYCDDSSGWNGNLPANIFGVTLFSGSPNTRSVSGLGENPLREVLSLADRFSAPLLIEADGARRRPLKAPAEHEPPIPNFVDTVVTVAGLSALEKSCTADNVHRPEIYAELSGIEHGKAISLKAMANVLLHPLGGLKNIPRAAQKIALLNQVDTPELYSQAEILAARLLPAYDRVVIAALNSKTDAPYITGVYNASMEIKYG